MQDICKTAGNAGAWCKFNNIGWPFKKRETSRAQMLCSCRWKLNPAPLWIKSRRVFYLSVWKREHREQQGDSCRRHELAFYQLQLFMKERRGHGTLKNDNSVSFFNSNRTASLLSITRPELQNVTSIPWHEICSMSCRMLLGERIKVCPVQRASQSKSHHLPG